MSEPTKPGNENVDKNAHRDRELRKLAWWMAAALVAFTIVFCLMTWYAIVRVNAFSNEILAPTISSEPIRVLWFLGILGGGVGLFLFRRWQQFLYGVAEVIFAVSCIWYTLQGIDNHPTQLDSVSMVGFAYLIVRGLDNCDKAIKSQNENGENARPVGERS
jgi:hypothetical protein